MITLFKTVKDVHTPFIVEIDYVLEQIKTNKVKDLVDKIRSEKDKQKKSDLKEQLPAICFSGEFKQRSKLGLIKHSGFLCLDFDKFENKDKLLEAKEHIISSEYTYACFISPSGNGLKVVVKIPECNSSEHEEYYLGIGEYFNIENIDTKTKDVSRVCYASCDSDIYINKNSILWKDKIVYQQKEYKNNTPSLQLTDINKVITYLKLWWDKKYSFNEGSRNENLYILANAFNEFGVPKNEAEQYLNQFIQEDFKEKEIQLLIKSAYKNIAGFNTKFFEDKDTLEFIKRLANLGENKTGIKEKVEYKNIDSKKIDSVINEIVEDIALDTFWTKSERGKVTILNNKFRIWLTQSGFYKYYPEHSENFVFVHKENNLIDNTNESKIKDYVFNYLMRLEDISIFENMAIRTSLFKDSYLNILDNINIQFKEDTEDSAYIYFKNGTVEVTKESINLIDYVDLDGFIWKKHIINKDFKKIKFNDCDFAKFIYNISGHNDEKELSIKTTIGYLLHSYKNSAKNFAVILNDETISENPNGGTGKGIIINAISKLKRCAVIDGKTFSFDKSFPYQTVSADTHIIVFDDVRKNFNFENLFSIVTEGITLEKKNKDAIKIPIEKSPKVLISTNYAVGGEGSSFERRKWDIELSQHYTVKNTPLKEFGKLLFDQWNNEEWLSFYNYMIDCLQLYLKNGLVKTEFTNSKLRIFIASTCTEFYEWIDEGHIQLGYRYNKKEYYEKFIKDFPDKKMIHQKTFNKWVKAYSIYKEYSYNDGHSNTGRWFAIVENENTEIKELQIEEQPF